ncbi:MAG: hypothetical protein WBM24_02980, partial [Candidatus Sulfotelmatobacter sp.]
MKRAFAASDHKIRIATAGKLLLNSEIGGNALQSVYILSAVRTPIGKFGGSLASLTSADIGVVAAKAA